MGLGERGDVVGGKPAREDHREQPPRRARAQPSQKLAAVHPRQRHVEQDQVGTDVGEPRERLGRGLERGRRVAGGAQHEHLDVAQIGLVVDHENLLGHADGRACKGDARAGRRRTVRIPRATARPGACRADVAGVRTSYKVP